MTMVRARRKRVENPTNTTQSIICQENGEQSCRLSKKLNIRWKRGDKSTTEKCSTTCPSMHHLDKAVVLDDIANSSSHTTDRSVLGDKTNQSSMSPRNQKRKNLNRSTDKKSPQKMSCNAPASVNEERSTYKLSVNGNLSSTRKSLGVVSSEGKLENQAKSSKLSENCIYTKVQRETLRNKNMPLEEKLAQYEFEVDENEPVVKKKKKKNVTRRKKLKSNEEYCPPSKVFQKIFQAGVEEAEERIKTKPKNVANLKSEFDFPFEDNCTEQTRGSDVQDNALRPLGPVSNRESLRTFSKNLTPVGRPNGQTEKIVGSGNFVDLEVNVDENNTLPNRSLCEKSLPKLDQDVSVVSCTPNKMPTGERRCNNKSGIFKSPNQIKLQLASSFGNTVSTPVQNYKKDARSSLSNVTLASTPIFRSTPLFRHSQATTNVSPSIGESSTNHSVNWNKRVFVLPRESGGVNSCENVLAQNWSVDNCFGFDDGSEESTELPPLRDISSKRRLRNNSPVISPISFSNKRKKNCLRGKENEISPLVKRKSGITALVSPNKSFKLGITDKNTSSVINKSNASINTSTEEHSKRELDTSIIEKPPSPVAFDLSPFSKPLKQTKLDFLATESNTSTCETPKKDDQDSPLLFKDVEDKTPIHFKQPARKSYVRSVRKKMRPVGFEWIEVDSESEEEGVSSHHPTGIKKKRVKLNKYEEKEANKWMKDFNRQCEEIEGFELCVEK